MQPIVRQLAKANRKIKALGDQVIWTIRNLQLKFDIGKLHGKYRYQERIDSATESERRIDALQAAWSAAIAGDNFIQFPQPFDQAACMLQDGQKPAVDANGRFDRDIAIQYVKALSQYDLFWHEEPGDPLDFELQATLRNYYDKPMATGEDLFSMQGACNLIRYGGMRPDRDWLQFDCALGYGLVEYLHTLEMLSQHGGSASRCIPHGGHQMSLNIAAGLGFEGKADLICEMRKLAEQVIKDLVSIAC